jgi:hypothetical protein
VVSLTQRRLADPAAVIAGLPPDRRRLTFAGNILETGTESYRLAHARAQRTTP